MFKQVTYNNGSATEEQLFWGRFYKKYFRSFVMKGTIKVVFDSSSSRYEKEYDFTFKKLPTPLGGKIYNCKKKKNFNIKQGFPLFFSFSPHWINWKAMALLAKFIKKNYLFLFFILFITNSKTSSVKFKLCFISLLSFLSSLHLLPPSTPLLLIGPLIFNIALKWIPWYKIMKH